MYGTLGRPESPDKSDRKKVQRSFKKKKKKNGKGASHNWQTPHSAQVISFIAVGPYEDFEGPEKPCL